MAYRGRGHVVSILLQTTAADPRSNTYSRTQFHVFKP